MSIELRCKDNSLVGFCDPMGDNREKGKRTDTSSKKENLSLESSRFSRDLLQRFMGSGGSNSSSSSSSSSLRKKGCLTIDEEEEEEGDLELSLGLSLGGRFGVDKSKLIRSSSIAACLPIVRDDDVVAPPVTVYPSLVRTSSMPAETEEWRKRKEMQSLRRMEAKRRRSEKQKSSRPERDPGEGGGGGSSGGGLEEVKKETEVNWRRKLELFAAQRFGPSPCRANAASSISRQGSLGSGADWGTGKGKVSNVGSQGSIESQGGSPSSISALESNALPGSSSGSDLSPASIQSLQEGPNQDASSSGLRARANTSRPARADSGNIPRGVDTRKRGKEAGKNEMENMPCVFTIGDGPHGRRVDGILYKYGKGEEVRIMCVCHGNFLSPAEFVTHAGGSDVGHPLKHIVINPNPPSV